MPDPAPEPAFLDVGRIVRPHGLRGQVVVELWTNREERLATGSVLRGPSGPMEVARATLLPGTGAWARWLVSFEGVGDREAAEGLRDAVLQAEAIADSAALWVHELIGATVVDAGGELLGEVEAVEANPASDLLVLSGGGLIPLHFVVERRPGRLTVDIPPGLLEP